MDKIYDGKKLAYCFDLASSACKEIESLAQLLNNTIIKSLEKNKVRNTSKFEVNDRSDDSGWIFTDLAQSIGILEPKKKKPSKYLGYQISLLGDGMIIAKEPLVHFFYWDTPVDFDSNYIGFPFEGDTEYKVERNHLIIWGNDKKYEWMFSVRLVTINDESDVKKIVQTVMELLNNEKLSLPSDLPGLISYSLEGSELNVSTSSKTSTF